MHSGYWPNEPATRSALSGLVAEPVEHFFTFVFFAVADVGQKFGKVREVLFDLGLGFGARHGHVARLEVGICGHLVILAKGLG
ncbi:hypothetical protein X942_5838 [Burkholderia pseudomallei MSHR5596]|nr:hypothetical protein X942_5838 [Burkholderia pseudomallei MSHR5596]